MKLFKGFFKILDYRFGVCCVQIIDNDDDTDVTHNDTYLQNPGLFISFCSAFSLAIKGKSLFTSVFPKTEAFQNIYKGSPTHAKITNVGPNLRGFGLCTCKWRN